MRASVVAALIVGALLRIAVLPLGVPVVDDSWRAWSYQGARHGPWNLYGPKGHTVRFGGIDAPVVYPPLALDELAIVGRVHMAMHGGRFENDIALTRTIKGAIVILDGVLSALLVLTVRRAGRPDRAWWAAMAYWANPAALMITTLGYIDVFVAIPAVGAVAAASCGRPWLAGALLAAAVLTKPHGLFVAPVVGLALWKAGAAAARLRRVGQGVCASVIAATIVVAPVIAVGKGYQMLRSVAVLAGHDMLSALAFNIWWIVSYLIMAAGSRGEGVRAALTARAEIVTHVDAMAHGVPNPRVIGLILLAAAVIWALRTARHARDPGLHAALGAFVVVAYFTLSVQVHENHFFLALPLMAIAAALRPAFAPVFAALSVAFALNLYLPFGIHGDGAPDFVWSLTIIDPSVVIAAVTCGLFAWLTVVFARECAHAHA
ncbi:MAG: hypothetical protein ACRD2I_16800 [Vicinamibacterales bacterium]